MNSGEVALEPVYLGSYDLSYTCLLIPRHNIRLEGVLAAALAEWLQKICAERGWRVEFVTVTRDYFQWSLRVVPSTQTAQFMKEIRARTSELALSKFGDLRRDFGGEFWAPGYLVVLGTRPHSEEMIAEYIRMSRRQQALSSA
jgi:REP element-mobilizing transposase RayT